MTAPHVVRVSIVLTLLLIVLGSVCPLTALAAEKGGLVFSCVADNDLYRVANSCGMTCSRYDDPMAAVQAASKGAGVLLLADQYPHKTQKLASEVFSLAVKKQLRLYIEYPATLPGIKIGPPQDTEFERGVIASDAFGPNLKPMRIVAIHDCHFVLAAAANPHLVIAKVAGLDTAVYGLPKTDTWPLLFEDSRGMMLVSTTKLSQFVTARYAPLDAWKSIWKMILGWLQPGRPAVELKWEAAVRPTYTRDEPLPADAERQAIRRANDWILKSRMLIHPSWREKSEKNGDNTGSFVPERGRTANASKRLQMPMGDGACGVLEGYRSTIRYDGSQDLLWSLRTDCTGEEVAAFVLAGKLLGEPKYLEIGKNLADFALFTFDAKAPWRCDPTHPAFGLLGWACPPTMAEPTDQTHLFFGVISARVCLSTLAAASILNENRWDDRALQIMLANYRTTGQNGIRYDALTLANLEKRGWQRYHTDRNLDISVYPMAQLLAMNLAVYQATGYRPLLERTKQALELFLDSYPHKWRFYNGLQQDRARILLPLAWLVRVEDTPRHREWLKRMTGEFIKHQAPCGGIPEELGSSGRATFAQQHSNDSYGTSETSVIHSNGEPICDLLYTLSSGFVGLHEAAMVSGDPELRKAEDRLAAFLCRIQTSSTARPELDGTWFRAFDFDRWEYWGANGDAGWGAWCVETGWIQGWLVTVMAMRQLDTTLWDLVTRRPLKNHLEKNLKGLFLDREPATSPGATSPSSTR